MPGELYRYLSEDHDRLDGLLKRAVSNSGTIESESYAEFRKGLLRHISIEEKIIFPAITQWQDGKKSALANRLHIDHGAIVSLLAPPPALSIIRTILSILEVHNPIEEQEGGLYGLFEDLAGSETDRLLAELRAAPAVSVLPNNPKPEVLEAAKLAVAAAGYEFKSTL